ncbi:hypothetical protein NE619_15345 [Anaerovorax odorimutans]|uniref:Uncharacterized protein n=1 Tax=Anaerovorax odorimutans TaxID=109327 RepID=A0ABT1RTB8_9FIRM|nr:hypothetical protein [Anaerovorax odorimutans]MCQ4638111.1 hypothetical protein [Anaerovorax odorimutans]
MWFVVFLVLLAFTFLSLGALRMPSALSRRTLIVFSTLLVLSLLTACHSEDPQREVSKVLGLNTSKGALAYVSDTHGGFHGDGTTYIELTFTDESFENALNQNSQWHPLPLSDNLTALVYGEKDEHGSIGPYLTGDDGKSLFPAIKNGYYFFEDRQSNGKDSQDDSGILKQPSFNVTLAIYDIDTRTLHFCEFDT